MTGFAPPPSSPGAPSVPRYDYYGAPPAAPGYPMAPPPVPPARRRAGGKGKLLIVVLALVAIVGLILMGVGWIVSADAWNAEVAAENECRFNPPTTGTACTGDQGTNIESQTEHAYDNATALDDLLGALGFTITAGGLGFLAVVLMVRRMNRLESGSEPGSGA